ncbi:hypothetical protein R9C00_00950 [Flammeovirgaceae bacterium SG7u.111]|nr:hypothetical protein [Flammeovirgaceae bacterium SG7u.132]WPO36017.1 hypothetical protein R9C00_00950 [Flammeovirgaceae bacterium SG7u.111]
MLQNQYVGDNLDSMVILPNYLAIVDIIEKKIHLAQADEYLQNHISYFINHVYMYQAIRQRGLEGFPEDYAALNFNNEFYSIISNKTKIYQARYNELINLVEGVEIIHSKTSKTSHKIFNLEYRESNIPIIIINRTKLESKKKTQNNLGNSSDEFNIYFLKNKQNTISFSPNNFGMSSEEFSFLDSAKNKYNFYLSQTVNQAQKIWQVPIEISLAEPSINNLNNELNFTISFLSPELNYLNYKDDLNQKDRSNTSGLYIDPSIKKQINKVNYVLKKDLVIKYENNLDSKRTLLQGLHYDTLYHTLKNDLKNIQNNPIIDNISIYPHIDNSLVLNHYGLRFRITFNINGDIHQNIYSKATISISSWKQKEYEFKLE